MSKLFSRTRSAATVGNKNGGLSGSGNNAGAFSDTDDFGRVRSMAFKRGKTDSALERSRQRTLSNPNLLNNSYYGDRPETPKDLPMLPDGIFLSTNLTASGPSGGGISGGGLGFGGDLVLHDPHDDLGHEYGYIASENNVILGLDEVVRLVDVVAEELGQRGLTTPLLFSPLAIDIRPNVVKKLIAAFTATCPHHLCLSSTESQWREEAAFAGPQELAMLLRWGLARIVRLERGIEVRGFITWDTYVLWRQQEQAYGYQPDHLTYFTQNLDKPVRTLFTSLFHLFIRFAANANSSGLTPVQIASLFGPLIFGLGDPSLSYSHAYAAYLRSSHATEHLLLAFIRWQESQTQLKGSMPTRLKDWVRGYPSMIPELSRIEKPRRGSKLKRLALVRRNVRLYSPDLVKNAASWSVPKGELQTSKEWNRIAPAFIKLQPRYSDDYRKYINVPPNFHPEMGPGSNVSEGPNTPDDEKKEFSVLGIRDTEDERFRSLTDAKWGAFESFGFSDNSKNKLAFDLTESARKSRTEKRETLSWNDFSSSGFTRTDEPLSATLEFSTPVTSSISSWESQSAEIHRKLKKAQKNLPPFGWDTTPVLGREEMIEEGFLEVFASLIYGSGWMDRSETTFRDCNWALVEFKALPTQRPPTPPSGDPRTSTILFLFEEFVPQEYRDQLAAPKKKGLFAPTALFVASLTPKSKQWKPATTLNGKPYVVGNIASIPPKGNVPGRDRESDFENMLKSSNATTKVSLTRGVSTRDHPVPTPLSAHMPLPESEIPPVPPLPAHSPIKSKGRFKLGRKRSGGIQPAEYDEMDFETREASDSDSVGDSPLTKSNGGAGQNKRLSKDDAWIDILVADTGRRRLPGQDVETTNQKTSNNRRKGGIHNNRSDPELAREEMEKVLAGVPPPDDDGFPFNAQPNGAAGYGHGHRTQQVEEPLPDPEPYPYANPLPGRRSMESDEYTQNDGPMIRVQSPSTIASRHDQRWPAHHARESTDSGDFEPVVPNTFSQEVEIPSFIDSERNYSHELIPPQPTSATLPPSPSAAQTRPLPANATGEGVTAAVGGKKPANVSTLIDMFQQKGTPPASKLPVRTASLENPKSTSSSSSTAAAAATAGVSPPLVPTPALPAASSSPKATGSPAIEADPAAAAALADLPTPKGSPSRYVHGAPLHNVMEEEEED